MREARGIEAKDVAKNLKVTDKTIWHIEGGRRQCSTDYLIEFAIKYEVSTDFLLGLEDADTAMAEALCRQAFRLFMRQYGDSLSSDIEQDLRNTLRLPHGISSITTWVTELHRAKARFEQRNSESKNSQRL